MDSSIIPFVPHLYPVLMKVLNDEDGEVRGNCTYALGVLAAFGGEPVYVYPSFDGQGERGMWVAGGLCGGGGKTSIFTFVCFYTTYQLCPFLMIQIR
jgi:hypothetical protein